MKEGHFDLTVSHYRYSLPSDQVRWGDYWSVSYYKHGKLFITSWERGDFCQLSFTKHWAWEAGLLTEEAAGLTIQCRPWHEMLTYPSPSWKFMFSFLLLPINSERHKKKLLFMYFMYFWCNLSPPLSFPYIYIYIYIHNRTNHKWILHKMKKGNLHFPCLISYLI